MRTKISVLLLRELLAPQKLWCATTFLLLFVSQCYYRYHLHLQDWTAVLDDETVHIRAQSPTIPKKTIDLGKDGGFCPETVCPIGGTSIRDAWAQEPGLPDEVEAPEKRNEWAGLKVPGASDFQMLLRDKTVDTFISGTLAAGKIHDPHIRNLIVREVQSKEAPVFIDVGANTGYFSLTALALGAKVVSIEPFRENMGVLMSSIRRNGWTQRSHLYMNAASYESVRVSMKSTNTKVNLSNMSIRGKECISSTEPERSNEKYGLDYMEAVSLDQVMLTKHPDITHVDLIKIDVETHEVEVLNGSMRFLCNRIINKIVMEVLYLKPSTDNPHPTCNFESMHTTLERLGFTTWDPREETNLTGKPLASLTGDVIFRQEYSDKPPALRLEGTENNPCAGFEL